jgi:hypothetical protein
MTGHRGAGVNVSRIDTVVVCVLTSDIALAKAPRNTSTEASDAIATRFGSECVAGRHPEQVI